MSKQFAVFSRSCELPETDGYVLKLNSNADWYNVVFFGGESFSNFKVVGEAITYAKENIIRKGGKTIWFSIDTNATILNQRILRTLVEEIDGCLVSIDGPREVQDYNRPYKSGRESFSTVIRNIATLKENGIPIELRASFTSDLEDIVKVA